MQLKSEENRGIDMDKKKLAFGLGIVIVSIVITILAVNKFGVKGTIVADYPYYSSIEELVEASDLIIVCKAVESGRVEKISIAHDGKNDDDSVFVYTLSDVEILKVIKGNYNEGDKITIKQLGDYKGTQDDITKKIDGYIKSDTEYLLFLKVYNETPCSAVNPGQGIVEIKDGYLYAKSGESLIGKGGQGKETDNSLEGVLKLLSSYNGCK